MGPEMSDSSHSLYLLGFTFSLSLNIAIIKKKKLNVVLILQPSLFKMTLLYN